MNEQELLARAKTDENALNELLSSFKPLVMSTARQYYLIGGELDDLIQEGMIGLYRAVFSYLPNKQTTFKTFATLCINRQIQSAVKKSVRDKNKPLSDLYNADSEILDRILSNDPNPEDLVARKESLKEINTIINIRLSPKEKKILREYLNGKTYAEIATQLNITVKSVDNGLNRIIKKLQQLCLTKKK